MYKPYKAPVTVASPDVNVPEPKISKFVLFLLNFLCSPYMFFLFGFPKIFLGRDDILFDAFRRALSKESRCIIAFRHPDGREPQLLAWFFLFKLRSLAAKKRVFFPLRPHSIFVYGYEVARWGGPFARFFMPNIGAIPIHHTKLDSKGMAEIYKAITGGPYPVSLAPEGQVSYSCDALPRLETGVIRIGLQAADRMSTDILSDIPVEILPLSIHFRYGNAGKRDMEKLLFNIEKICGFSGRIKGIDFYNRIKRCRDKILEANEKRYGIKADDQNTFEQRLEKVTNAALETAERLLGIKSEGDFFARLYKARHICWDRIFLPELDRLDKLSKLERSIKDLGAGEAWHIARHQELADFAWYFRHSLPVEETALHAKIEYVQNLFDFANRSMGGAITERVNIFPQKIIIQAAPPINLTSRLSDYNQDKKATIESIKSELESAYLNCINEVNKVY
ncbi:MAG: acyltransferase [Treponema sp.]|jgi:1-acyl-sn-glycerol-3-phosphate acyltransferase|nr:acyltransferase [Treponema sp.]